MTDLADKLPSEPMASASTSRSDRAWGVVVGAGLLMFVNLGPVLYYTSGIFTKAITDDTGWTRGTIAAASVPANLLITVTLPLVGWAVDAYGTRRIALLSSILFAVGMFLLAQLRGSRCTSLHRLACIRTPIFGTNTRISYGRVHVGPGVRTNIVRENLRSIPDLSTRVVDRCRHFCGVQRPHSDVAAN
jgi:Na+/melibiose symporter-like transporter